MIYRLILLFLLLAGGLPAAAQDPASLGVAATYTVRDVEVDASGTTTVAARDNAFVQGQRTALAKLLERLGVDPARVGLDSLSADAIAQLMHSFQVNEERTSPGRYRANLTFRFRPDAVRALLGNSGLNYTEQTVQPILVLPVYRAGDRLVLWDSPNPWLEAWLDYADPYAGVPVMVPLGELADVTAITAEQAVAGDPAALSTIVARYGTAGVAVATATETDGTLSIVLDRFGPDFSKTSSTVTVPAEQPGQPLYADAVAYIADAVEQAGPVVAPAGQRQLLSVLVPLAAPDDWFRVRERLGRIPAVAAASVSSLSLREAAIDIEFIGTEEQLRQALATQNLALQQGPTALELRLTDGGLIR